MKGVFIKRGGAFYPSDDYTYDKFRKIKEGKAVTMEFKQQRNNSFHRKYFALLNTAWAYLTEEQEKVYGSLEGFRKTIQVAAGFYEPVFDLFEERFLRSPKSIAFDKMEEHEFEELYERVKDILFTQVLKDISIDEFMANLNEF